MSALPAWFAHITYWGALVGFLKYDAFYAIMLLTIPVSIDRKPFSLQDCECYETRGLEWLESKQGAEKR